MIKIRQLVFSGEDYSIVEVCISLFLKVGDPKQLPATVLSNVASRYMYECSMFERLQRAGYPVIMLTEQVTCILVC